MKNSKMMLATPAVIAIGPGIFAYMAADRKFNTGRPRAQSACTGNGRGVFGFGGPVGAYEHANDNDPAASCLQSAPPANPKIGSPK